MINKIESLTDFQFFLAPQSLKLRIELQWLSFVSDFLNFVKAFDLPLQIGIVNLKMDFTGPAIAILPIQS